MAEQAIALNRFGLGVRPKDAVAGDPRAWLVGQFARYQSRPATLETLPPRAEIATALAEFLEETRGMRRLNGTPVPAQGGEQQGKGAIQAARKLVRRNARDYHLVQVGARMRSALASETPFVERLVHFWANHFAVSAEKLTTTGLAGMLEIEAIRPHVLGRFGDLLLAAEQHPAMLLYLDQAQSIGPQSPVASRIAARRGDAKAPGLNENLAREILELHTLGVRTGYQQADVTELARGLTGWTVAGLARGPVARLLGAGGTPGDFAFAEALHEPGERVLLGRRYPQRGEAQARAMLADLAVHPATARHVATKLVRHFVADNPPPALVARVESAFLRSGGDLPTVYRSLVEAPEAWATPAAKFKTPWDWLVSALRAIGSDGLPDQMTVTILNDLGQPVWRPGSPAGYDDIAQSWIGPDALIKRVEVADRLAARLGTGIDARLLAPQVLPGTLAPATAGAIARADTPAQALAMLLVSPEFLRR